MTSEFNLSDKMAQAWTNPANPLQNVFYEKDVKEFIKIANEGVPMTSTEAMMKSEGYFKGVRDMIKRINELAGDKLV